MFGKFFRPQTHYVFDYKPRYYNERKERLEKLKAKYEENKDTDIEHDIDFSKHNLRESWERSKKPGADRATMLRLALIITILVGILTYIFDLHSLF